MYNYLLSIHLCQEHHSYFFMSCRRTGKTELWEPSTVEKDVALTKHFINTLFFEPVVVVQSPSCFWLCDPMDCSIPGVPVLHLLPEFAQIHVFWVSDAIQLSYPLSSPSPLAFNLSQLLGLLQWVSSSHQVAKVLALQLQHQSFQWIFRFDFL